MEYYFKKHAIRHIEGKCRKEGFIRPNSIKVISYSTGLLQADNVVYDVVFSADVCYPCEDMIIKCKIINITKIGIRAIISEIHNPIVLFISREHNASKNFEDYEEGNVINIKVIGHRFELNDEYISVIGEII
jgi:DNA-directed RNA polymerase subunit E'/Rpb7